MIENSDGAELGFSPSHSLRSTEMAAHHLGGRRLGGKPWVRVREGRGKVQFVQPRGTIAEALHNIHWGGRGGDGHFSNAHGNMAF